MDVDGGAAEDGAALARAVVLEPARGEGRLVATLNLQGFALRRVLAGRNFLLVTHLGRLRKRGDQRLA